MIADVGSLFLHILFKLNVCRTIFAGHIHLVCCYQHWLVRYLFAVLKQLVVDFIKVLDKTAKIL